MGRLSRAFRRPWLSFCVVATILCLVWFATPGKGAMFPEGEGEPSVPPAGVRQLVSNSRHIRFTLDTPTFEINHDGTVHAAGLDSVMSVPGAPALPYYSTLIALPPAAEAQVDVRADGIAYEALARPPRPAARAATNGPLPDDTTTWPAQLDVEYTPDPEWYQDSASFPDVRYRLSEPKYYRDVRYVQLDLFPLQYRPEGQQLAHARTLQISVTFAGAQTATRQPAGGDAAHLQTLAGQMLNPEQMAAWRSLPASLDAPATKLPVGKEVYKIEVDADGIYAITGSDLQAAGMNLASVDPATLEMLYRGESVAYEFRDEAGDGNFDVDDAVYFYGWTFDGPRTERQFITNNVFWLWAGGNGRTIKDAAALADPAEEVPTSFRETVTREEEHQYMHTRTDDWDQFPNEPDSWYWQIITKSVGLTSTVSHEIVLPDPATAGSPAQLTFEYLSSHAPSTQIHEATVHLNDASGHGGSLSWFGLQSVNVTATVPVSALLSGANQATTTFTTANNATTRYYLNRITVEYQRLFQAQDDRLLFTDHAAPHTYEVGGFTEGELDAVLVWDISERRQPQRVPLVTVTGSNPYTYTFSTDRSGNATFIATTVAQVEEPLAIEQYVPPDLDPVAGGADWVAITHPLFTAEVNRLAAHRQQNLYGGLQTQVVEIEDVINQYGYGLPLPAAIQDYLAHALASWQPAPTYVLLVGDATVNPRDIDCNRSVTVGDCDFWGPENDPNLVPTDILFVDRFQGTVISDHTFVLLSGDDLVPDMAIGRLAVQTPQEAKNAIDKIMLYEKSYLTPQAWHDNILFLSDNADGAGDFCPANYGVNDYLPSSANQIHLCLEPIAGGDTDITPTLVTTDVQEIRVAMSDWINGKGVSLLNYRGHGGVQFWGGYPMYFMRSSDLGWWNNYDRPPVILSLDCLDGFFAYPGLPALSETFIALERVGSVAHWSSTGLGLTSEHTVFQTYFYEGLYGRELDVIGDTIVYAKMMYDTRMADDSELYSFTLQGDPAMRLFGADLQQIYLPQLAK